MKKKTIDKYPAVGEKSVIWEWKKLYTDVRLFTQKSPRKKSYNKVCLIQKTWVIHMKP